MDLGHALMESAEAFIQFRNSLCHPFRVENPVRDRYAQRVDSPAENGSPSVPQQGSSGRQPAGRMQRPLLVFPVEDAVAFFAISRRSVLVFSSIFFAERPDLSFLSTT